jgi:hypothetical protein
MPTTKRSPRASKKSTALEGVEVVSACLLPGGSVSICMSISDDFTYTVQLFTDEPVAHPTASTCLPIELSTVSENGSQCLVLPFGNGPNNNRWVFYSCENTGSTSASGPIAISDCRSLVGVIGCKNCQKPVPVALTLQLETLLKPGSSNVADAMQQPVPLFHSQNRTYPCCWFSQPLDAADAGGNPAYWILQKIADNTWSLILRRVSHELAKYQLTSKDSHRFPIKLTRVKVSKDFKNWPPTITVKAAK